MMRKRRDKGSTPRADPASASSSSASSSSRLSISKVLTTAVDNVSPRGLNSPWQGSFQLGPSSASTSSSGSAYVKSLFCCRFIFKSFFFSLKKKKGFITTHTCGPAVALLLRIVHIACPNLLGCVERLKVEMTQRWK